MRSQVIISLAVALAASCGQSGDEVTGSGPTRDANDAAASTPGAFDDASVSSDAGRSGDASLASDASTSDATPDDAGSVDAALVDGAGSDAASSDAETLDTGLSDSGPALSPDVPSVAFSDTSAACNLLSGDIVVTRASDESDVLSYAIYWGSSPTQKLSGPPIAVLSKSGTNVVHTLATVTPPLGGANFLAFSVTSTGERPTGAAVRAGDAPSRSATDVGTGLPPTLGDNPRMVVDAANGKVLIATENNNNIPGNLNKAGLFRCDLDGANCAFIDVSALAGQGTQSAAWPVPFIDTASSKLLIVANHATKNIALYRCALDGSSCTFTAIGESDPKGYMPSPVIDAAAGKLLIVTTVAGKPQLHRCNLDGSSCDRTDISTGQGSFYGEGPTAIVDAANATLLVVMRNLTGNAGSLTRCALDGTGCAFSTFPAASGWVLHAMLDPLGESLYLAGTDAIDQSLVVSRCALNGTGCVAKSLKSLIPGSHAAGGTRVDLDPERREIVVTSLVTSPAFDSSTTFIAAVRCPLGLGSCVFANASPGQNLGGIGSSDFSTFVGPSGRLYAATFGFQPVRLNSFCGP